MLRSLDLTKSIYMEPEDVEYYGGKFSFFDKLRQGGIGSPKMIYQEGIAPFNEVRDKVSSEMCYVSVELLRTGMIIRLYSNYHIRAVGLLYKDLQAVQIGPYDNEEHAALMLRLANGEPIKLLVQPRMYRSVMQFWEKGLFAGKLEHV